MWTQGGVKKKQKPGPAALPTYLPSHRSHLMEVGCPRFLGGQSWCHEQESTRRGLVSEGGGRPHPHLPAKRHPWGPRASLNEKCQGSGGHHCLDAGHLHFPRRWLLSPLRRTPLGKRLWWAADSPSVSKEPRRSFACYFLSKRELHRPGALSPHQHAFDMSIPPFSTKEWNWGWGLGCGGGGRFCAAHTVTQPKTHKSCHTASHTHTHTPCHKLMEILPSFKTHSKC